MANQELSNLAVKISLDSTGFQNGVSSINKQMAVVQSEFKASSAEMGGFANSSEQLGLKSSSLSRQIDLQKQKVVALEQAFQTSAEKKGLDARATQELQIKTNNAKTALANMEAELGKANKALDEGVKKQGLLAQSTDKLHINLDGIKTAFGAVGIAAGAYLGSAIKAAQGAQESTARLANLLQNQGISAEDAGKGIKSFTSAITKMSSSSGGEAKEALQTLTEKGISLGKALEMESTLANVAAGRNISLSDAANMVADAYHGKTRALVSLGILSKEEVKLLGDAEDAAISMADVQERLNNRFGGAAQAQLGTYNGQMKQMENQLKAAKTAIGSALLPVLTILASDLVAILTPLAEFIKQNPKFSGAVISLTAVFGTLIGGLSLFNTVKTALTPLGPLFALISGAAGGAILPILAIVAAIALLAAGVYLVIKNWGSIKEFFSNLWIGIKDVFQTGIQAIIGFLKNFGPLILVALTGPIGLAVYAIATHWDTIKKGTETAWKGIKDTLANAWTGIKNTSTTAWDGIKNGVVDAFQWMYNHNYYFQNLVDSIRNAWNLIKENTTVVWNAVKDFTVSSWGNIKDALSIIWESLKIKAGETWDGISTHISTIWGTIKTTAGPIWDKIKNNLAVTWGTIKTSAEIVLGPIETIISGLWTRITSTLGAAWIGIQGVLLGAWNNIKTGFANLATEAWNWGVNLLQQFIQGIKSKFTELANTVKNAAQTVAKYLGFHSPTEEGPGSTADTWAPNLMNMFSRGLTKSIPELKASLGRVAITLQPAMAGGISSSTVAAASNQGNGIDYIKLGAAVADALSNADIRTNLTLGNRELTALNRSLQPIRQNEAQRRGGQI